MATQNNLISSPVQGQSAQPGGGTGIWVTGARLGFREASLRENPSDPSV